MSEPSSEQKVSYFRRANRRKAGETVVLPADQIQFVADAALRGALEEQLAQRQEPRATSNLVVNADSNDRLQSAFQLPTRELGVEFTAAGIVHTGHGLDAGYTEA